MVSRMTAFGVGIRSWRSTSSKSMVMSSRWAYRSQTSSTWPSITGATSVQGEGFTGRSICATASAGAHSRSSSPAINSVFATLCMGSFLLEFVGCSSRCLGYMRQPLRRGVANHRLLPWMWVDWFFWSQASALSVCANTIAQFVFFAKHGRAEARHRRSGIHRQRPPEFETSPLVEICRACDQTMMLLCAAVERRPTPGRAVCRRWPASRGSRSAAGTSPGIPHTRRTRRLSPPH